MPERVFIGNAIVKAVEHFHFGFPGENPTL